MSYTVPYRFQKHYTREEARALLPRLRQWLDLLTGLRQRLEQNDRRVTGLMTGGQDTGGETVNRSVKLIAEIKQLLQEFQDREIMIKDLERGLLDFPALMAGREVFLCWEKDETDVEFWHDLDSGYAGREPL
jgi:hypothetical protein